MNEPKKRKAKYSDDMMKLMATTNDYYRNISQDLFTIEQKENGGTYLYVINNASGIGRATEGRKIAVNIMIDHNKSAITSGKITHIKVLDYYRALIANKLFQNSDLKDEFNRLKNRVGYITTGFGDPKKIKMNSGVRLCFPGQADPKVTGDAIRGISVGDNEVKAWETPHIPFNSSPIDELIEPQRKLNRVMPVIDSHINPSHYKTKAGTETIDIIEEFGLDFCLGNAVKYITRAGKKDGNSIEQDLKKSIWYIERRIKQLNEQK